MPKIKDEDIDLLREKADLVEVISSYSHLKKAGGNTFKGLCPFHSEKTPSFTVDTAKGLFHCFGCGEGGNVYQFVQKIENLPFPEAVEWVARRFNYELRYEDVSPGAARAFGKKRRLADANRAAAEFFHRALMESPDAESARAYLSGRGFDRAVAERWQLGYSLGRDSLTQHLIAQGYSKEELVEADLSRVSERDGALYDTFRQRIMFPTWSLQDDVVAFGARALGDQQPKYLNTGDTPLFSKSRFMYGLNRARFAIARSGGQAIVVEGYTDVIALHEAGITGAVATNGTALGESHFELIKKFSSRAVLMFDADNAGKNATERGFGLHHRIGLEVLVAPLPPGRDPADVVTSEGADAIEKIIENGRSLLEFKLDLTLEKLQTDTPEARARAVREAVQVLGWHPDPIARHEYAFMIAKRIGVEPEAVQRALSERRSGPPVAVGGSGREADRRVPGHVKVEREALQLLLSNNPAARQWLNDIGETDFTSPARRELLRTSLTAANAGESLGADRAERMSPEAAALYTELVVAAAENEQRERRDEVQEIFVRLKVFSLEREIKKRRATLQELNPLEEAERHDALFTELVGLEARRRDLLRSLQGAA
jgi:DNA primase